MSHVSVTTMIISVKFEVQPPHMRHTTWHIYRGRYFPRIWNPWS